MKESEIYENEPIAERVRLMPTCTNGEKVLRGDLVSNDLSACEAAERGVRCGETVRKELMLLEICSFLRMSFSACSFAT